MPLRSRQPRQKLLLGLHVRHRAARYGIDVPAHRQAIKLATAAALTLLRGRFDDVSAIAGALERRGGKHAGGVREEAERVDYDVALHGLDGIDHHRHAALVGFFEHLEVKGSGKEHGLGVDIDGGEPAAKAGMGVVPTDDVFHSEEVNAKRSEKATCQFGASIQYNRFDIAHRSFQRSPPFLAAA